MGKKKNPLINLDRNIKLLEERKKMVDAEIERIGFENMTVAMKDRVADYLIEATELETRGGITTQNRMVTINRRETSREGLVDKLEGGESAFYSLIKQDKNTILTPKTSITDKDLEEVPGLSQLRREIDELQARIPSMPKSDQGKATKMLIEMRRDQYSLKNAHRQPIFGRGGSGDIADLMRMDVCLQSQQEVSALLANYTSLKIEHRDNLDSDIKWILEDLDALIIEALEDTPSLLYILQGKINGESNEEIRDGLIKYYGVSHTQEYISSLYKNKIPKEIAKKSTDKWVDFMFMNKLKGSYKKCSKCGEIKLANNRNFSINRTSSSYFYSICKECRNAKK